MKKSQSNTVMLETNVDDVTGETLRYAVDRLLEEGAQDAHLIPIISKKGRPGVMIRVLCKKREAAKFARIIGNETGTLGVKEFSCSKHMFERSVESRETRYGKVRVKIAKDAKGNIVNRKVEYEDVKRIAKELKKPLGVVRKLIDKEVMA